MQQPTEWWSESLPSQLALPGNLLVVLRESLSPCLKGIVVFSLLNNFCFMDLCLHFFVQVLILFHCWFSYLWLIDAVHIYNLWTTTSSSLILWTFLGRAFLTGDFSNRGFLFILTLLLNPPLSLSGCWEPMSNWLQQNPQIYSHFSLVRYS